MQANHKGTRGPNPAASPPLALLLISSLLTLRRPRRPSASGRSYTFFTERVPSMSAARPLAPYSPPPSDVAVLMRCWSEEGPFLCDPRTDGPADADGRRRNSRRRRGVPGMSHGHRVLLAPGCEILCVALDTTRPDLGSNVAVDDVKFWEWPARRTRTDGRCRIAQRSEGGGRCCRGSPLLLGSRERKKRARGD